MLMPMRIRVIFGPDSPTTNPHTPSVTPDALDIVITKNLSIPVYLASCSALSSDHLAVLIDTTCRSSFHHPPDRPDIRRTDGATFQNHLEELIPFDPLPAPMSGGYRCCSPSAFALLLVPPGT